MKNELAFLIFYNFKRKNVIKFKFLIKCSQKLNKIRVPSHNIK